MTDPLKPFTVGQLVLTSLETFFSAASLHLGDALPDGRKLDATDPQEAWRAVLAAAHRQDPLADIRLGHEDYAWITSQLLTLARRHAGGRLVSTLEGGYDLAALAASVAAHVGALME